MFLTILILFFSSSIQFDAAPVNKSAPTAKSASVVAKKSVPVIPKPKETVTIDKSNEIKCGAGGFYLGSLLQGERCESRYPKLAKEKIARIEKKKEKKAITGVKTLPTKDEKKAYSPPKDSRKHKKFSFADRKAKLDKKRGIIKKKSTSQKQADSDVKARKDTKKEEVKIQKKAEKKVINNMLKQNDLLKTDPKAITEAAKKIVNLEKNGKIEKAAKKNPDPLSSKITPKLGKLNNKNLDKVLKKTPPKPKMFGDFYVHAVHMNLNYCCHFKSRVQAQNFANIQPEEKEFKSLLVKGWIAHQKDQERKERKQLAKVQMALKATTQKEVKKDQKLQKQKAAEVKKEIKKTPKL
jgi:hypothetical protein